MEAEWDSTAFVNPAVKYAKDSNERPPEEQRDEREPQVTHLQCQGNPFLGLFDVFPILDSSQRRVTWGRDMDPTYFLTLN